MTNFGCRIDHRTGRAAGTESKVGLVKICDPQSGVAGGEYTLHKRISPKCCEWRIVLVLPCFTAVHRSPDAKPIFNRVAQQITSRAVHKFNGVPEALFVGVGEEKFPSLAAVAGLVESGLVAGAGGHNDGGVFVEGLDAAEVEFFGAGGQVAGLPEVAAVFGAEDGAVGSAGPGDSATYVVDAAEAGGRMGLFNIPLGVRFAPSQE